MNPGGGAGWDESPLDIQIPDDARELERDVLAQAEFPLRVAKDIRKMDPVLFHAPPIKLELRPAEEMAL